MDVEQFVRSVFRDANEIHKRAWAHLESLRDSIELCPPTRFLVWALGDSKRSDSHLQDPRGIWLRLWQGELGLADDTIRRIASMHELCSRIHLKCRRLRSILCEIPHQGGGGGAPSNAAAAAQPQQQIDSSMHTEAENTAPSGQEQQQHRATGKREVGSAGGAREAGGGGLGGSLSLQALEVECLDRIRSILRPIEMIRFCVWADQNRLTIAALDT